MRLNIPLSYAVTTHEGAPAAPHLTPEQQLRRSVLSCLLWEDEFYESGVGIADRIEQAAAAVPPATLAALAIEARGRFHLRHVPLLLLSCLAQHSRGTSLLSDTMPRVIQRADELAEFVVVHARMNGVAPSAVKPKLSKQIKLGLARAFQRFDASSLAKYNRDGVVKLRDVLFLAHPKPKNAEQAATWKALVDGTLPPPDTWEVALSAGADKKTTWERLISEGRLGYLALLRNLRNMDQAAVDAALIGSAIRARENGAHRVLPFRYVAAARAAPQHVPALDDALKAAIGDMPRLSGRTVVLVDVSGSMDAALSAKSDLTRLDAAAALAAIVPADHLRVFSFSNQMVECPPYRGLAGIDAVVRSQAHQGTRLFEALAALNDQVPYDRIVVITDEQAHGGPSAPMGFWASPFTTGGQSRISTCPAPKGRGYMVNVASNRNGVGYGAWTHVDGFSERVLTFIAECERQGGGEAAQLPG